MKAVTLITVTDVSHYKQCTLILDTFRVGFPTEEIFVAENHFSYGASETELRCRKLGFKYYKYPTQKHHPDFIEDWVMADLDEPLVVLDPDIIFWSDCEWMVKTDDQFHLMGHITPAHWNHWAKMMYAARVHASFMIFPNVKRLQARLAELVDVAEYRPFNPFRAFTVFDSQRPMFFDTCANLYHAVGAVGFKEKHLNCYDHLNSASFYREMLELFASEPHLRAGFERVHELAVKNPQALKGLWKEVKHYYDRCLSPTVSPQ